MPLMCSLPSAPESSRRLCAAVLRRSSTPLTCEFRGEKAATPVVVGGRIFTANELGVAVCVDAATGRLWWKQRLGGRFLASPVVSGGRVYFTDEAGRTTVVDAAESFRRVSRNDLKEKVFATPAPGDGRLYLRTEAALYCIRES